MHTIIKSIRYARVTRPTGFQPSASKSEQHILKEYPDIISGEVRDFMKVHNKKLKADEHGNEILQTKVGGRTPYYTETQKVFQ
ncbi:hypothetical protein [Sphingobacterium sp.]|uniref:hypothetical protein n=1 Tax=Sphingobacterium sp. TaxID=341027 RepID=UPI0028A0114E|nr:hypothetical protein [Sphingobacterium sp.]